MCSIVFAEYMYITHICAYINMYTSIEEIWKDCYSISISICLRSFHLLHQVNAIYYEHGKKIFSVRCYIPLLNFNPHLIETNKTVHSDKRG